GISLGPGQSAQRRAADDPRTGGAELARPVGGLHFRTEHRFPCFLKTLYLLQVPTMGVPLSTDPLFSPLETSRKQFGGDAFQVVQKPSLVSFQVPSPLAPDFPKGSRTILPS